MRRLHGERHARLAEVERGRDGVPVAGSTFHPFVNFA
jgi:hypothetical protein